MFKIYYCASFLFIAQIVSAQVEKMPVIDLGISNRGSAIVLADKPIVTNRFGFDWSSLKHFRVTSLAIDIKKNIFNKHCFIELSNYFRYGHFRYERDPLTGISTEIKRFKHDHLLDFLYEFGKHKQNKPVFILGAGYGPMNLGTAFSYNRYIRRDAAGNPIFIPVKSCFCFYAPRLIVGVRRNKLQGFIIVHGTPDEEFESNPTLWIEGKASYSFHLKSKKSKFRSGSGSSTP